MAVRAQRAVRRQAGDGDRQRFALGDACAAQRLPFGVATLVGLVVGPALPLAIGLLHDHRLGDHRTRSPAAAEADTAARTGARTGALRGSLAGAGEEEVRARVR